MCAICDQRNNPQECRCPRCSSELEIDAKNFLDQQTRVSLSSLKSMRLVMISRVFNSFMRAFNQFDERSGHQTSDANRRLALREYVKARTSHLAATNGWDDVAILHKRLGQGATREEREKYTRLAHIIYREWELGTDHEMEETGQIYGPAVEGFSFDRGLGGLGGTPGGHTWAVNAAWLLGHLHAGHRFIQVVPVTQDNVMRGQSQEEYGALYYEAALVRLRGMEVGRHEGPWTEVVPTHESQHTTLASLSQSSVDVMRRYFDENPAPISPSIALADIARAENESRQLRNQGPAYREVATWHEGRRVTTWKYVAG